MTKRILVVEEQDLRWRPALPRSDIRERLTIFAPGAPLQRIFPNAAKCEWTIAPPGTRKRAHSLMS
jgi:hypothetical protein